MPRYVCNDEPQNLKKEPTTFTVSFVDGSFLNIKCDGYRYNPINDNIAFVIFYNLNDKGGQETAVSINSNLIKTIIVVGRAVLV